MFSIPEQIFVHLNGISDGKPIFLLPPHNGSFDPLMKIIVNVVRPVYGLNWTENCLRLTSMQELAKHYLNSIEEQFKDIDMNFDLIGYSIGGVIAYEMSLQLQSDCNRYPKLILLDSSPVLFRLGEHKYQKFFSFPSDNSIDEDMEQIHHLVGFLFEKIPIDYTIIEKLLKDLPKDQRIRKVCDILIEKTNLKCNGKTNRVFN